MAFQLRAMSRTSHAQLEEQVTTSLWPCESSWRFLFLYYGDHYRISYFCRYLLFSSPPSPPPSPLPSHPPFPSSPPPPPPSSSSSPPPSPPPPHHHHHQHSSSSSSLLLLLISHF
eukprot:g5514.t1